jgi:hypothetical protein
MPRISYDLIYVMFFIVDQKIITAINSCAKHLSKALQMKDIPYKLNKNGAKKNSRQWLQIALEDMDAVFSFTWDTEKARKRRREELVKVLERWESQYDIRKENEEMFSRRRYDSNNEESSSSSSSEENTPPSDDISENEENTPNDDVNVNEVNTPPSDDISENKENPPNDDVNVNEENTPPSDDVNVNEENTPSSDDISENKENTPNDDVNVNEENTPSSDDISENKENPPNDDDGRQNTSAPSKDINENEGNEPARKRQNIGELKYGAMCGDLRVIGVKVDFEDVLRKKRGYVVPCWCKFPQGYWPGLAFASTKKELKNYSVFCSNKLITKAPRDMVPFSNFNLQDQMKSWDEKSQVKMRKDFSLNPKP